MKHMNGIKVSDSGKLKCNIKANILMVISCSTNHIISGGKEMTERMILLFRRHLIYMKCKETQEFIMESNTRVLGSVNGFLKPEGLSLFWLCSYRLD